MATAPSSSTALERELLDTARAGDEQAFRRLVEPYRGQLHVHCYRMLGSLHDAEDAVQETLLGAWRGLPSFEGRSSLRTWLYTIATNACLRLQARRPPRLLPAAYGPPADPRRELAEPVEEPVWVEPYPDDRIGTDAGRASPEARYDQRESVELAFVAALQHLPATQRAVLILRDVLGYPARDVAGSLDTSVASVNSALQRARQTVAERLPGESQQATLRSLGDDGARRFVARFVGAWERADVDAIVAMLADDATFAMPPLPAWFRGRADVGTFLAERVFATPWRFTAIWASGQPALACYQGDAATGQFRLSALNVFSLRGEQVSGITAFLSPDVLARFDLPDEPPD